MLIESLGVLSLISGLSQSLSIEYLCPVFKADTHRENLVAVFEK